MHKSDRSRCRVPGAGCRRFRSQQLAANGARRSDRALLLPAIGADHGRRIPGRDDPISTYPSVVSQACLLFAASCERVKACATVACLRPKLYVETSVVSYLTARNCKHIANARMTRFVTETCRSVGFEPPVICTPEELAEE